MFKAKLHYLPSINIEEYVETYNRLKQKYAKNLIESWPECTDPKKFVHEDIGITAYLLLLWKDRQSPCRFIDLGCGNGLLVYLLTEEGHKGRGLDIRKRKIWDHFPLTTQLEVCTVVPSPETLYPEADWLIGNHSDELTAWLPIIAARSSDTCQYFTIPCCPYQLNGSKYQRKNASLSVYQEFLEYVDKIGRVCGFETTADKLRIPSTKRICLIGRRKRPLKEVNNDIKQYLQVECSSRDLEGNEDLLECWISDFKPRCPVEPVRNCTQVAKDTQQAIILATFRILLTANRVNEPNSWNCGGELHLGEIAKMLPFDLLAQLKQENRGLQTLLKNHHQIFVVSRGCISFRSPSSLMELSNKVKTCSEFKWKSKKCWFYQNHPQGCPLADADCSYDHT